jgi:hypothetical protein
MPCDLTSYAPLSIFVLCLPAYTNLQIESGIVKKALIASDVDIRWRVRHIRDEAFRFTPRIYHAQLFILKVVNHFMAHIVRLPCARADNNSESADSSGRIHRHAWFFAQDH